MISLERGRAAVIGFYYLALDFVRQICSLNQASLSRSRCEVSLKLIVFSTIPIVSADIHTLTSIHDRMSCQ